MLFLLLAAMGCAPEAPEPTLAEVREACDYGAYSPEAVDMAVWAIGMPLDVDLDDPAVRSVQTSLCFLVREDAWAASVDDEAILTIATLDEVSFESWSTPYAATVRGDRVTVHEPLPPIHVGASVLYHEAAHDQLARHVPCAWDPNLKACDDDWDGTYGAQHALLVQALPMSEVQAETIETALEDAELHINGA